MGNERWLVVVLVGAFASCSRSSPSGERQGQLPATPKRSVELVTRCTPSHVFYGAPGADPDAGHGEFIADAAEGRRTIQVPVGTRLALVDSATPPIHELAHVDITARVSSIEVAADPDGRCTILNAR